MTAAWKPGDVAMVRNEYGVWNRAICTVGLNGDMWRFGVALSEQPVEGSVALPLVVIDPDVLPMDDLLRALGRWRDWSSLVHETTAITAMFDAIASQISPPKPPEPTGLGAVVEDEKGRLYIRTADTDCRKPWSYANNYTDCEWSSIAAVKVLSEGVTS